MDGAARTPARAGTIGSLAVVLAGMWAWGALAGAAPAANLLALGFLLVHVLLPGWILRAALGVFAGGAFTSLFGAWVLGHGVQAAFFLGSRALGCAACYPWTPLLLLPLLGLRRVRSARQEALHAPAIALALLLVALTLVRSLAFAPETWSPLPESDAHFHAGNIAELARQWPLSDPRLAGEPLRYHFFSYAFAAGASQVTGFPVWTTAYGLGQALFPLLLGCGLVAIGERCLGSRAAGFAAAFLVLLHEDLGWVLGSFLGVDLRSNSWLAFGVHSSPSACLSLAFLAAILLLLHEWSCAPRAAPAVLLCAFGALQSGTKGSSMPVVLAGLGLACAWELARTRRVPWRSVAAAGLLLAGALPFSIWLVSGPDDYASAMLRVAPLATVLDTPLSDWLRNRLGAGAWVAAAAALAWLAGYLGLAGLGVAGRGLDRARPWSPFERLLASVGAAGLAATLLTRAPGYSQLFFAYNGQLALSALAGAWVAPRRRWIAIAGALLLAAAAGRTTQSLLATRAAQRFSPTAMDLAHRAGQDWMRGHLPADAVLLVEAPLFLHSVHSEREVFFETGKFSAREMAELQQPEAAGAKPARSPAQQRDGVRARLVPRPSAELVKRARALLGNERPLYVVRERMSSSEGGAVHAAACPESTSPLLEALYENAAIGVYRVREP